VRHGGPGRSGEEDGEENGEYRSTAQHVASQRSV
jgi:hypothetical protein